MMNLVEWLGRVRQGEAFTHCPFGLEEERCIDDGCAHRLECRELLEMRRRAREELRRKLEAKPLTSVRIRSKRICGPCVKFRTSRCPIAQRHGLVFDGYWLQYPSDNADWCDEYEEERAPLETVKVRVFGDEMKMRGVKP